MVEENNSLKERKINIIGNFQMSYFDLFFFLGGVIFILFILFFYTGTVVGKNQIISNLDKICLNIQAENIKWIN